MDLEMYMMNLDLWAVPASRGADDFVSELPDTSKWPNAAMLWESVSACLETGMLPAQSDSSQRYGLRRCDCLVDGVGMGGRNNYETMSYRLHPTERRHVQNPIETLSY